MVSITARMIKYNSIKDFLMRKPQRTSKYFTPQKEDSIRTCDHESCNNKGEFRAPKDRSLVDYYWFCLKHVQEYNSKWNYYAGMTDKEQDEEFESFSSKKFKSKVHYTFDNDWEYEFFDNYKNDFSSFYSNEEKKFFKIMGLDLGESNVEIIKKSYKKLARKYHPDVNYGDKDMEEKFKELSVAYEYLINKYS